MKHPLYKTWCEMRYRCENPNKWQYKYYGALGVKVCERWQRFWNFIEDMGERPKGHTLDRIDRNGDYTPENCRWADKITQANNTRFNRLLEIDREVKTMSQWSAIWHVPVGTIWRRLELGWDVEDAIKRTVRKHKIYKNSEQANERQKL
jgi:hypothetical protein